MSVLVNGAPVGRVVFNGVDCDKVYMNGVVVFDKTARVANYTMRVDRYGGRHGNDGTSIDGYSDLFGMIYKLLWPAPSSFGSVPSVLEFGFSVPRRKAVITINGIEFIVKSYNYPGYDSELSCSITAQQVAAMPAFGEFPAVKIEVLE